MVADDDIASTRSCWHCSQRSDNRNSPVVIDGASTASSASLQDWEPSTLGPGPPPSGEFPGYMVRKGPLTRPLPFTAAPAVLLLSESVTDLEIIELPLKFHGDLHRKGATSIPTSESFSETVAHFKDFGQATRELSTRAESAQGSTVTVPTFVNEYWTARQRAANRLHEISYRACFKPQLPRFFIERLTREGDVVYDPFMGRGTTLVEAALLGRVPFGCDVNPLSIVLTRPRLRPPAIADVGRRLKEIDFAALSETPDELLVFYHPTTLQQIGALKRYLVDRRASDALDSVDEWIAMVALNRLTGHSNGFFSVYTLPPNQAVSVKSQTRINLQRNQTPSPRDVPGIILKKSRQLLGGCDRNTLETLARVVHRAKCLTGPSDATPEIESGSVNLVVTSPPFLNIVQYATDNWLRCWFLGIDANSVKLTVPHRVEAWQAAMTRVFRELQRVLTPGGHIAFEVGEVRGGTVRLEEAVVPCGLEAGLEPLLILINDQKFTKTANCWGVDNNFKGTNTNRIVLFRKPC